MTGFLENAKPFLPVAYIAIGAVLCAVIMHSCSEPPVPEIIVAERLDTIPGPSDTVEVEKIQYVWREAPRDSSALIEADSLTQMYIVSLWVRLDEVTSELDSIKQLRAVAVTRTDRAVLRAHLDMPLFLKEPKRGLWAEAEIISHDTTKTTVLPSRSSIWDYVGYGLYGGAGYNLVSKTVDVQIGAGLQIKLDKLFRSSNQ